MPNPETAPENSCPECGGDLKMWVMTHPHAAFREIERLRETVANQAQIIARLASDEVETMRERLHSEIARQDAERGRPLTDRERLDNLTKALKEIP